MAKKTRARGGDQPALSLPEMEDRRIAELDRLAHSYAKIRDARIELNKQERELKLAGLAAMARHKKTTYRVEDVEIEVEPPGEEPTLKVRIKKPKAQPKEVEQADGEVED